VRLNSAREKNQHASAGKVFNFRSRTDWVNFYRAALNSGRSSEEKAVRLSVCRTRALQQNERKSSRFLYHTKDNLAYYSEKKNVWWWRPLLYVKVWVNRPPLERNRRF